MAISLSTGNAEFEINFDNGKTEYIYFNPTDSELSHRMLSTQDSMEKRMQDIHFGEFNLSPSGNVEMPKDVDDISKLTDEQRKLFNSVSEKIHLLSEAIKEETDYIFNANVSSVVYKYCSPLALVKGDFFYKTFFSAITPEIKKKIEESYSSFTQIIDEHLEEYKD